MSNSTISAAMQLSVRGPMDEYLSGDPQVSLFDYSYKRIAPYSKNTATIPFKEKSNFGKLLTATLPRSGDVINGMHLYVRLPPLSLTQGSTFTGWTNTIGYAIIDYIEIVIGETIIDKQTGKSLEVMDYITTEASKRDSRFKCVGRYDNVNVLVQNALGYQDLYIPLQFWFNKKRNLVLPLTSLHHSNVKIRVKLNSFESCVIYDGVIEPEEMPLMDASLIADYYMLDTPDKNELLLSEQLYVIDQWQVDSRVINQGMTSNRFELNINKNVKELVVTFVETESELNNDWFNNGRRHASLQGGELISNIALYFDGKERLEKMHESYYRLVVPQKYHSFSGNRNIYVISFAEHPENSQPTGSVNFTRYDSIELAIDFVDNAPEMKMYVLAISNNILKIKDGTAQLEFLN